MALFVASLLLKNISKNRALQSGKPILSSSIQEASAIRAASEES